MRVYISGLWESRERIARWGPIFRAAGHEVTSSWLEEGGVGRGCDILQEQMTSGKDIQEIASSDLLVVDTFDVDAYGGREVEVGIALALHIPVVVVGPRRNIFHSLAIRRLSSWNAVLSFLTHTNTEGLRESTPVR